MNRMMHSIMALAVLALLLSACGADLEPTPTLPAEGTPSPSPAPAAPRTLSICLGAEPDSLYPYGTLSTPAREALSAVYDGPLDLVGYGYEPVILEKLPSLDDDDAMIESVSVYVGDAIVDAGGNPATLQVGTRFRPAGCREDGCALVYDGLGEVQMDQMVVNFRLLPGLAWADGEPLTAADSVFSYNLAANPETQGSKYLFDRTQSYEAVDDLSVQWWGKPGYLDPTFFANFWLPLPGHLWGEFAVEELPDTDLASRFPLGWGPYIIEEWLAGNSIRLVKNPYYRRAAEGLPYFDQLTFRFSPDPEQAISMLLAGQCDLLAPSVPLESQVGLLLTMEANGLLLLESAPSMVMENLTFGIQPASYDDGFSLAAGDRPDLLGDVRTRRAIALCIDRQRVVDAALPGLTSVPVSLVPSGHPLFDPQASSIPYDPQSGAALLDETGWKDADHDPATPRQAVGIPRVPDGTRLTLEYLTTDSAPRRQVGELLAGSLAGCGIQLELRYVPMGDFYAAGPEGPLFGRSFDLAQSALGSAGVEPLCDWFLSSEIPSAGNEWSGINLAGFNSPSYDAACLEAAAALPGDETRAEAYRVLQSILADELPLLPLYWRVRLSASRPDLCHYDQAAALMAGLGGLEMYDYGAGCAP